MTSGNDSSDEDEDDDNAGGMKPASSSSQSAAKKPRRGRPGKPVEQYDFTTGRTIARFDSQRDAERATGIGQASIFQCVRGLYTEAGGFGWRRPCSAGAAAAASSQPVDRKPPGGNNGKTVEKYDLATGRTIAQFDSQADAARATGIGGGSISQCVNGKYTEAGGFGWRRPGSAGAAAAASCQPTVKRPHGGSHASKPVEQYDFATGRTIAWLDSQCAAERATGISQASISKCVRGEGENAGGFGWRTPATGAALSPAPATPAPHAIPTPPSSCSSSAPATNSFSFSSSSSSSSSSGQAPPLPMITEQQRLRDAIFDRLLNDIYSSMPIAEKSARIGEIYELAVTVESLLYRDYADEYQDLLGHRAYLLDKLTTCPSIKALCT